jgi:glycosyltransferase involved in cell wall biosynthesis
MAQSLWRTLTRGNKRSASGRSPAQALIELERAGPAPLAQFSGDPEGPLAIAVIIPSFRRGSGGHATIARLLEQLSQRGHRVSVWLEDGEQRHAHEPVAVTRRSFSEFFDAPALELHTSLEDWSGADVVLATGWQTVAPALLLEGVSARAYLVQDHEPDFYGASSEAMWAAHTYRQGLHCIAASPWLAELLRSRYGASAGHFDLGVDHSVYRRRDVAGASSPTVAFYARAVTPRRAVPLGMLALSELSRRRPEVQIDLFGETAEPDCDFEHSHLGVLPAERLAELYSRATVGLVLSLTNPSLIGLEMMACGLPCVELASEPMLASFGSDGPLELAALSPLAICDSLERLIDDPQRRERAAVGGLRLTAERTWERAAQQLEAGLRSAISLPGPAGQRTMRGDA